MPGRKLFLSLFIVLFTAPFAFCQSEALKGVVNNLAFYRQKNDLKYLTLAKKQVDSLITTKSDSSNIEKNVYKAIVYTSILYTDSLNKLKQPADFLPKTTSLVDWLIKNKKNYKYQAEIAYAKKCLANVYLRHAFERMHISDYQNALLLFQKAEVYQPGFAPLNAYIAYTDNKLGNLSDAAKYYDLLLGGDSVQTEYAEAAASTYKALGDTSKALQIIQKARKHLPNDKSLLLDEANIYNNKHDYKALEPLLGPLLDSNPNNAEIAFVAGYCHDQLNHYDRAESLYLRSIELNSVSFDPVFNLGLLYLKETVMKRGDAAANMGRAAQWLEKASDMSPNDTRCLQVLQLIYAKTGDADKLERVNDKLKQLINQ